MQSFLERGYAAFAELGDIRGVLADNGDNETRVMERLFAGDPDPFRQP